MRGTHRLRAYASYVHVDGLDRLACQGFSGVVDVRRQGEVLFQGAYGLASPRWGVANTMNTRFDVASISKLFTSVAVLQLAGRGLLDLDSSIHEYADLAGTSITEQVTLRQLLTHTSGIADIAEEDEGQQYAEVFRSVPCHTVSATADFLPLFAYKEPKFSPGARRRYCNAGYVLAGLAVEHASGRSFREYVEAEILAAAGMSRSGYFDKRYAIPDLAEGFDPADGGLLEQNVYAYPPAGAPDGGAFCTAGDLHQFLGALRGGVLLPPGLTELFLTPQVAIEPAEGEQPSEQGFGLEFTQDCWWKEGRSEGASGCLTHYVAGGVDVVVLSNSMDGAWDMNFEIGGRARA
jgi:CubicO group peptidase (beta-lactamase class C family)